MRRKGTCSISERAAPGRISVGEAGWLEKGRRIPEATVRSRVSEIRLQSRRMPAWLSTDEAAWFACIPRRSLWDRITEGSLAAEIDQLDDYKIRYRIAKEDILVWLGRNRTCE